MPEVIAVEYKPITTWLVNIHSEKLINGLFIGYFPPIFITKLPILIKMRYKLQIKSQETSTF